jgi:hypothetical protein
MNNDQRNNTRGVTAMSTYVKKIHGQSRCITTNDNSEHSDGYEPAILTLYNLCK